MTLLSRNLEDATALYASVTAAVTQLGVDGALLDGEVVALDAHGRPSFQAPHHRASHSIVDYAFDVLHLNGRELLAWPLDQRRAALTDVLTGTAIKRSEPAPGTPAQIEQAIRGQGLEGVVAKKRLSLYEQGKRTGRGSRSSAGGTSPIGSKSRRMLNQSTQDRVANPTASSVRHGPRRRFTSVL